MVRRFLATVLAVAAVAVTAGCMTPPTVGNHARLVELFHNAQPVPPGPDGGWHLVVSRAAILGEGHRLARIDPDGGLMWSLDLPDRYALTGRPGDGYSGLLSSGGGTVLLLAGTAGSPDPVAIRGVDAYRGTTLWERPLPPHARVTPVEDAVVVSRCGPAGCDLTGVNTGQGTDQWHTTVAGGVAVLDTLDSTIDQRGYPTTVWVAGQDTVTPVSTGTAGAARPRPTGPLGPAAAIEDFLVLATRPAGPDCTATVTAYQAGSPLPQMWARPVHWDDPRAPRQPDGCRYAPDLPLIWQHNVLVPDAAGALDLDLFGVNEPRRLAPGQFRIANQMTSDSDGGYRTWPDDRPLAVPAATVAWALDLPNGATAVRDGQGITVCDYPTCDAPRWRARGARIALLPTPSRLLFVYPDAIVGVGPASPD